MGTPAPATAPGGLRRLRWDDARALHRAAALGWDAALLSRPAPDPCRTTAWLRQAAPGDAIVHAVTDAGGLAAAALLARARHRGLAVVSDLGAEGAWFDLTPHFTSPAPLAALIAGMAAERCDVLVLRGVEDGSAYDAALHDAFPGAHREEEPPAYRIALTAPSSRLTKRRAEARRCGRRAAEAGRPLIVTRHRAWEEAGPLLDEALDLQAAGFRGREPNGLAGDATARGRTATGLRLAARHGWLRLTRVVADGALVAFDVSLVAGRNAVGYASGFSRAFPFPSLGWVAFCAAVDAASDEGAASFDLGAGLDGSHKRLAGHPVPRHRVVVPRSARGRAAVAARRLARRGRR